MGTKFFFMVDLAKIMVDSYIPVEVTMGMKRSTDRKERLVVNTSSGQNFLEFNYFVTNGSFTADGGFM